MSPQHTRKTFFAKLAGLIATVGIAPKLLAKPISESMDTPAPSSGQAPFTIRTEKRAIARTSDSQ